MGKRGRKPSKERKGYFFEEQEDAVIRYNTCTDEKERNEIYNNILHPSFCKMIESIINRYKLYVPDEEFKDTFDDTISFLMTKIALFNPDKGYKAYSYCGTICKNYLILKVKKYNKNTKINEPFDNVENELSDNINLSYKDGNSKFAFLDDLIVKTIDNIKSVLETDRTLDENEIKVGKALVQLMSEWEDLCDQLGSNKFNKSAILLFLKESTLLSTTEIRNSMKKFKIAYYDTKKKLLE